MRPPRHQKPNLASNRNTGDIGARLEAMQSLVDDTLVYLDPADVEGLAVLRQRFNTTRREFETHRLEANEARQRMRAYIDGKAQSPSVDLAADRAHGGAASTESQGYAQDAILVAVAALEEAELATLEAILNKLEAHQSTPTE